MALLSRQGGALLVGFACALIGNSGLAVAQTSTLPQGWSHADVGAPVVAGNATGSGSSFTVVGAGTDIGGSSDEFQFAYQAITGDVDIQVQVSSLQNVDPAAKAGIMIREALTGDAEDAFMYVSAGNGLAFQRRSKTDHKALETSGAAVAAPVWVRLVRQGNTFTAYSSTTGASWTQVASANINMNAQAYVGLAVTSHVASKPASATFANVSFGSSSSGSSSSPSSPSLPSPWATSDIGSPSLAGSASASAGTFTVTSGGQDIYNTSDQFRFVYQPVTGDTQVVAYVGSLTVTDAWAKAGVMIRADLTAPAAEATTVISGSNGWQFDRRLVPGGITYDTNGSGGTAPAWIRIVREGNLFSSYSSRDGSQWTLISTDTITMPATAYVGLAVTSHNTAATTTASFSNVTVSKPTSSNTAPTVSISAPAAGTTYTAPGSMTITATAGDTDGSITKVEFYAGSTLLGSDTSSPYSFTWNNVAAGSYSLTAVATDNGGATTKSQAVSITVGGAANKPPTVSLTAPAAGTSYAAPASMNVTATAADSDGSIAKVEFYAGSTLIGTDTSSPYSVSWNNVAAGTYSLTAVATDNGGAKTTSTAVSITVGAPAKVVSNLIFAPPTDYSTNVTSLKVEVRRSTDATSATPLATMNLGKPAVVNGEITVDISSIVDPLAAGSYYTTVVATGPYGSTPSAPSPNFSK